ncbi:hypothetical protein OIO90_006569 [Microbotryomycetes sp. JL221]|nr:hypothetical protein OIO90_006569 [Microbotryomycetes sp. JL221]
MADDHFDDDFQWTEEAESQMAMIEMTQRPPSAAAHSSVHIDIELEGDQPEDDMVPDSSQSSNHLVPAQASAHQPEPAPSLWQRFRRKRGWGNLSVSDLVGPSWCEVQTVYRLNAKSNLRPELRPSEIVTASGSTIKVDTNRTAARDVILAKGKHVHRDLEIEAMGDATVKVGVTKKEEWWALRLLNTMTALDTLITTGLAREIPVVGSVQDLLVLGVVDEIVRKPRAKSTASAPASPTGSASSNKRKKIDDPNQRKLSSFFRVPPSPQKDAAAKQREVQAEREWAFFLVDSKTRYNRSLPPADESKPSRLQVMLYYRLLTAMLIKERDDITSVDPFDWTRLAETLSLDLDSPLSDRFLSAIVPLNEQSILSEQLCHAKTLLQFIECLHTFGDILGANDASTSLFEPVLALQYRLRQNTRRWKPRKKTRLQQEEEDIQKAIAESLKARKQGYVPDEDEEAEALLSRPLSDEAEEEAVNASVKAELARLAKLDTEINPIEETQDSMIDGVGNLLASLSALSATQENNEDNFGSPDLHVNSQAGSSERPAVHYNLRRRPARRPDDVKTLKRDLTLSQASNKAPSKSNQATPGANESELTSMEDKFDAAGVVIGTVRFKMDSDALDAWLADAVKLWKSERLPRGVDLNQTKRCRTCEFEDGCDWRTSKALEIAERVRAKREAHKSRVNTAE